MIRKNAKIHGSKREKQTRYLSQAIQLEEAVNPHIIHATMTMISLALLVFIGWAAFTNINEVARTPGEIVPQGYQKTVQHFEGGIVKEIVVREGQIVEEGDVLIVLADSSIREDMERAKIKQAGLDMQAERLRAFLDNRSPDFSSFAAEEKAHALVDEQKSFFEGMMSARAKERDIISKQIEEKKQSIQSLRGEIQTVRGDLGLMQDMHNRRSALNKKGYASDMQVLEDRRQINGARGELKRLENQILVAQKEIEQFEDRLASLSAGHRDQAMERLSSVTLELAQNQEIIQKLQERIDRLQIRSPSHGLVKGLTINTVGAIVQPGQTLMEIVPLDKSLEVSVKISPQDIGHLKLGQPVHVKFSTYDFSRYGYITGQLDQISATTFATDNGERYYQGRVILDKNYVGQNPANIIMPGMTVMADVITGEKTILQYLLKPIHLSLQTAFSER